MNFNQYKVDENGVGTPVNPYNKYEVNTPNDWDRFEFYKISNTIQTVGVKPGTYPVDAFVEECQVKAKPDNTYCDDFERDWYGVDKSDYTEYGELQESVGLGYNSRIVYTLKEETPAGESVAEAAREYVTTYYGDDQSPDMFELAVSRFGAHFIAGAKWQSTQPNPELTRLKALVEKYEMAFQEIEHDLDHLDRFELNIPKLREIATNALNQQ